MVTFLISPLHTEDLKERADRIELQKLALKIATSSASPSSNEKVNGECGSSNEQAESMMGVQQGRRADYAQTVQRLQNKLASR